MRGRFSPPNQPLALQRAGGSSGIGRKVPWTTFYQPLDDDVGLPQGTRRIRDRDGDAPHPGPSCGLHPRHRVLNDDAPTGRHIYQARGLLPLKPGSHAGQRLNAAPNQLAELFFLAAADLGQACGGRLLPQQ